MNTDKIDMIVESMANVSPSEKSALSSAAKKYADQIAKNSKSSNINIQSAGLWLFRKLPHIENKPGVDDKHDKRIRARNNDRYEYFMSEVGKILGIKPNEKAK